MNLLLRMTWKVSRFLKSMLWITTRDVVHKPVWHRSVKEGDKGVFSRGHYYPCYTTKRPKSKVQISESVPHPQSDLNTLWTHNISIQLVLATVLTLVKDMHCCKTSRKRNRLDCTINMGLKCADVAVWQRSKTKWWTLSGFSLIAMSCWTFCLFKFWVVVAMT